MWDLRNLSFAARCHTARATAQNSKRVCCVRWLRSTVKYMTVFEPINLIPQPATVHRILQWIKESDKNVQNMFTAGETLVAITLWTFLVILVSKVQFWLPMSVILLQFQKITIFHSLRKVYSKLGRHCCNCFQNPCQSFEIDFVKIDHSA